MKVEKGELPLHFPMLNPLNRLHVQAWSSFAIAVIAMTIGILNLPVDNWVKGYMGMGLSFTVGSTFSVAKTTRDMHEAKRITSRIEEARVEKLLNEHHPLK